MARDHYKRKAARLESQLFLEISDPKMSESLGRGVVVDFSLSGCAIDTEADLNIGADINCHIEIPIEISAKVVRRVLEGQIKRYGLKFLNQGFFDKMFLKKVMKGSRKTKKV